MSKTDELVVKYCKLIDEILGDNFTERIEAELGKSASPAEVKEGIARIGQESTKETA